MIGSTRMLTWSRWPRVNEPHRGETLTDSWGDFAESMRQVAEDAPAYAPADKKSLPLWNLAEFDGAYRDREHHLGTHAIIIDYDSKTLAEDGEHAGNPDLSGDDLRRCFGRWAFLAHTTPSHRPGRARWRGVLPLSRPATRDEHDIIAKFVLRHGIANGAPGLDADRSWMNPAQSFYVPVATEHYEWIVSDGPFLDVDEVIRKAPETEPPALSPSAPSPAASPLGGPTTPYGEAVLTNVCGELARAHHGARHRALIKAACRIGQFVGGGEIESSHAVQALFAACVENGLSEDDPRDVERTTADGLARGACRPITAPKYPTFEAIRALEAGRRSGHKAARHFAKLRRYQESDLVEGRFLPQDELRHRVTYIRAPKGAGKTEFAARLLPDLVGEGARVAVTHRRSLARAMSQRLRLPCYLDTKGPKLKGDVVVVVNSLKKLAQWDNVGGSPRLARPRLLVLDELEQMLRHFYSGTMDGPTSIEALDRLRSLIRRARHVLVMDADLSTFSVDFVRRVLGWEDGSPDNDEEFREVCAELPWKYQVTRDLRRFEATVLDAFQGGQRVALASFSARHATRMGRALSLARPDAKVVVVTRQTAASLKDKLADVNAWISTVDAIVYSPVIGTGVSIDVEGHFDRVFGCFQKGIGTAQDAHQMLHRVRAPASDEILIYVAPQGGAKERRVEVIEEALLSLKDTSRRLCSRGPKAQTQEYAVGSVIESPTGAPVLDPRCHEHFGTYVQTLAFERRHGGPGGAIGWALGAYLNSLPLSHPWIELDEEELSQKEEGELEDSKDRRDGIVAVAKEQVEEERIANILGAEKLSCDMASKVLEPRDSQHIDAIERAKLVHFYGAIDEDVIEADRHGRLRRQARRFSEVRAVLDGHEDVLAEADRVELDIDAVSHTRHRLQRALKMVEILERFGLDGLDPDRVVPRSLLPDAARWARDHSAELTELGFTVRGDVMDNPVQFLSGALRTCGLKLKSTRERIEPAETEDGEGSDDAAQTRCVRNYSLMCEAVRKMEAASSVHYHRLIGNPLRPCPGCRDKPDPALLLRSN